MISPAEPFRVASSTREICIDNHGMVMANLEDWWERLWGKLQRSPALLPTTYAIPANHTDKTAGPRFKRDAHYFTVTVHRMFLRYDREFWTTYAPMALVVSEFQYDGHDRVVPFVVGTTLLEGTGVSLPDTLERIEAAMQARALDPTLTRVLG